VLLLGKRMVPLRKRYLDAVDLGGAPSADSAQQSGVDGQASSHLARAARSAPVGSRSDAVCLGNPVQRNRIVGIEDGDGAVSIHHHRLHQTKDLNLIASDKDIVVAN
jgi:hypothetical protein